MFVLGVDWECLVYKSRVDFEFRISGCGGAQAPAGKFRLSSKEVASRFPSGFQVGFQVEL